MDFRVGDNIYFTEGEYEYEAKVIRVNAEYKNGEGLITVEHADENGNLHKRAFNATLNRDKLEGEKHD